MQLLYLFILRSTPCTPVLIRKQFNQCIGWMQKATSLNQCYLLKSKWSLNQSYLLKSKPTLKFKITWLGCRWKSLLMARDGISQKKYLLPLRFDLVFTFSFVTYMHARHLFYQFKSPKIKTATFKQRWKKFIESRRCRRIEFLFL